MKIFFFLAKLLSLCSSFIQIGDHKIYANTHYVFDLELPKSFKPFNNDGEVDEFELVPLNELIELITWSGSGCSNNYVGFSHSKRIHWFWNRYIRSNSCSNSVKTKIYFLMLILHFYSTGTCLVDWDASYPCAPNLQKLNRKFENQVNLNLYFRMCAHTKMKNKGITEVLMSLCTYVLTNLDFLTYILLFKRY